MADSEARQFGQKTAGEVRNVSVSFVLKLDSDELLTGTPTATASPSGPTITNVVVNTGTIEVDGDDCLAGEAVQFRVSGGTAGVEYVIKVVATTDASVAQTLHGFVRLSVVADPS